MHQPLAASNSKDKRAEDANTHRNPPASAVGSRPSPPRALPRGIASARQLEARHRLASELRMIALDLLGLYEAEEMSGECARWVRTTIESAVAEICDPAISTLTHRLAAELRVAPSDVARRIDLTRRRHEAGFA
jgi:hypothetical protein